jgi:hypothetical protein
LIDMSFPEQEDGLVYNSQRQPVKNKEFGRGLQELVAYVKALPDEQTRTQAAHQLVKMVRMLHPGMRKSQEEQHRVWDQLHMMADFELGTNSPFPEPSPEKLSAPPERMTYPEQNARYRHYGHGVEHMLHHALTLQGEERLNAIDQAGRVMKNFYRTWTGNDLDNRLLLKHMQEITQGKVELTYEEVEEHGLFEVRKKSSAPPRNDNRHGDNNRRRKSHAGKRQGGRKHNNRRKKNKVYPKKK